jgi:hypothetical protein
MSPAGPACIACGSDLEEDQEYCLDCGARQVAAAGPQWRRVLIAAAVAIAVAALVLAVGYERMRDNAEADAAPGQGSAGKVVRQAAASAPAVATGGRLPPPQAPLGAGPSR